MKRMHFVHQTYLIHFNQFNDIDMFAVLFCLLFLFMFWSTSHILALLVWQFGFNMPHLMMVPKWYGLIYWSICFCSVTKNFFENLVRALENGLCDVDSNGAATSKATSSKNAAGSSKGKSGRGKGTKATVSSRLTDDNEWSCEQCTYANVGSATACAMCNQERQWPTRNTCFLLKG